MAIRNEIWVVLADAHQCRLLRCGLTRHGRCHVEEYDSIQNTWPGHEHHRPSPLHGKTGDTYAAEGKEANEELTRFARQVADWLDRKTANNMARVAFFAPPRFLGALRRVQSVRLAERLEERKGEMIHLPIGVLSKHPAIRDLLDLSPNARQ